ncbi:MAG: nitronate monooxygenase, partial [Gaiellaceae bacterium]
MTAALRTRLCEELGIEYPIFSVGFGPGAGPELAAAVSDAGGCGVLGGGMPAVELRRRIAATRELTGRPFGVNVIVADLEDPQAPEEDRAFALEQIAVAIEERPAVLVLFWGDPAPF